MFNLDIPIDNVDDDVLDWGNFAEKLAKSIEAYDGPQTLTIGLNGSWGSGKTSLINLTIKQIDTENYLVIHFNPWFFSNQNNLYLQFLKLIINELKNAQNDDGNPIGRKMKHIKTMFEKTFLETLQNYYDYFKSDLSVNLNAADAGFSASGNHESFESLQFHKYQCDVYFEQLEFKLLIIIDDIDRLVDEEIKQVFTLVKSLANFPKVIYLLAFDKNVVAKSLDQIHSDYADKFLSKIIQIPIFIPQIGESKLDELILTNVEPIYKRHLNSNFINSNNEFIQVSKYLAIFIKDIRDLKRYINVLNFYIDIFVEELNINDFFLILAIELFEYNVFLKIREYKDVLTYNSLLFANEDDIVENEIRKVRQALINNVENTNSKELLVLLEFLFPILRINNALPQNTSKYDTFNQEYRLGSKEHFEKYYTLSLGNNEVSAVLLNRLIHLDDVDEICEIFTHNNDLDYNHSLLIKFSRLISEIQDNKIENYIKAIMKCGDDLNVYHVSRRRIEDILDSLIRRINDKDKCFEILKECIGFENNLLTVLEYVYALAFYYGLAGTNEKIESETEMPVNKEQAKTLIKLTIDKTRNCSEDGNFLNQTFLQDILTYWELLDNVKFVKKYVLDNVKSDDEILSFLSRFQTIQKSNMSLKGGRSKTEMRFDFKKLDKYHGLDFYENKINVILSKENSDDINEFCNLFINQLEDYKHRYNLK